MGLLLIGESIHLRAPTAWANPANVDDKGYDRNCKESLLALHAASNVRTGMSISTVRCQMGRVLVDQVATGVSGEMWSSQQSRYALAAHRYDMT